jgi:nucleoside-diphosphate-sugar epimerase
VKRVLVTGARGFIGRHVLPRLLSAGVSDLHATTSNPAAPPGPGVEWHQVDLLDVDASVALVRRVRPTHLLHLAWITTPDRYWTSDENERWFQASGSLLDAFLKAGGTRVVVAGTCAEYDWLSTGGVCDEVLTPLRPGSQYGRAKDRLRSTLQSLVRDSFCSWAWGRLFWLYGPGEAPHRLVASIARTVLSGEVARCHSGSQLRDFLYVENAAEVLVHLLQTNAAVGAFNIGSGVPMAVRDVALAVGRAAGRQDLVHFSSEGSRAHQPRLVVARMERTRSSLPPLGDPISFAEGVAKSLAWWRERAAAATAS